MAKRDVGEDVERPKFPLEVMMSAVEVAVKYGAETEDVALRVAGVTVPYTSRFPAIVALPPTVRLPVKAPVVPFRESTVSELPESAVKVPLTAERAVLVIVPKEILGLRRVRSSTRSRLLVWATVL